LGVRQVRISDLSGKPIPDDSDMVILVVTQHPAMERGAKRLEALPGEVKALDKAGLQVVVCAIQLPGEDAPRRVVVERDVFDKLASDRPMAELLNDNEPTPKQQTAKTDYTSLEHAGRPHRGIVTAAEAQVVRDNLDEINLRLAQEGLRLIDPRDPEHQKKYGLVPTVNGEATDLATVHQLPER
jgi:hypothetical protein